MLFTTTHRSHIYLFNMELNLNLVQLASAVSGRIVDIIDTLATSYQTYCRSNDMLLPVTHPNHDPVRCKDFDIECADLTDHVVFIPHKRPAKITPK